MANQHLTVHQPPVADRHLQVDVLQRSLPGDVPRPPGAPPARTAIRGVPALSRRNGYYGAGDVDALVARRLESLRNPTGKSFEDHAPDGRWFRILRSRAAAGGTVTVMTDVTEQKAAERDLVEATRRTEEDNKVITEKNRTLEALYREIRDKNGETCH